MVSRPNSVYKRRSFTSEYMSHGKKSPRRVNPHVPAGLPSPIDELSLKSCVIAIPTKAKATTRLAGMSSIKVCMGVMMSVPIEANAREVLNQARNVRSITRNTISGKLRSATSIVFHGGRKEKKKRKDTLSHANKCIKKVQSKIACPT